MVCSIYFIFEGLINFKANLSITMADVHSSSFKIESHHKKSILAWESCMILVLIGKKLSLRPQILKMQPQGLCMNLIKNKYFVSKKFFSMGFYRCYWQQSRFLRGWVINRPMVSHPFEQKPKILPVSSFRKRVKNFLRDLNARMPR